MSPSVFFPLYLFFCFFFFFFSISPPFFFLSFFFGLHCCYIGRYLAANDGHEATVTLEHKVLARQALGVFGRRIATLIMTDNAQLRNAMSPLIVPVMDGNCSFRMCILLELTVSSLSFFVTVWLACFLVTERAGGCRSRRTAPGRGPRGHQGAGMA